MTFIENSVKKVYSSEKDLKKAKKLAWFIANFKSFFIFLFQGAEKRKEFLNRKRKELC